MLNEIKIIPLEKKYLSDTIKLINHIFPNEDLLSEEFPDISSIPSKELEASLNKNLNFKNYKYLKYFIALNKKGEIVGTTGLYSLKSDNKDHCWLGWFCVSQKYRNKGIGKLLLNYSVNKAKKEKKKYLNLYTSTNPNEAVAQIIYEKNDFYITKQKRIKQGNYKIFFRQKKL